MPGSPKSQFNTGIIVEEAKAMNELGRRARRFGVPVMVSGSRTWTDRDTIQRAFEAWWSAPYGGRPGTHPVCLIHGGARGADRLAAEAASLIGWHEIAVPADWTKHSKRAGFLRNIEMLEADPAHVFIFWDGESRGTKQVIDAVQGGTRGLFSYSIERSDDVGS